MLPNFGYISTAPIFFSIVPVLMQLDYLLGTRFLRSNFCILKKKKEKKKARTNIRIQYL
jgi:hypothetical protein